MTERTLLKHWEGTVIFPRTPLSPNAESIVVQLVDLGPGDREDDAVMEILLRRLNGSELSWLRREGRHIVLGPAGLCLDFKIWRPSGAEEGYAEPEIVFRKDRWTPEEVELAKREAEQTAEAISWFTEGAPAGSPTVLEIPTLPDLD